MNYNNIFPSNLLGTHANFVDISETNNIFICGDYHGRYEDDDCSFLFFNKETNEFFTDSWSTRGYCTNSPWSVPCVDINCVEDETLIDAIKTAAKSKILSDMDNVRKGVINSLHWNYSKYTRKAGMQKAEEVLSAIDYTDDINAIDNLPQLISFFYGHDSIKTTCGTFYNNMVEKYALNILNEHQKKARSIKLYGKDYTGEVFMCYNIPTRFGTATKVGIKCGDKNVYALLNSCGANEGDTITINGTINEEYTHDNIVSLSGARRIDNIDPARIVRCGDAANTDTTTDNPANATDKTDNADNTDTKTDNVAEEVNPQRKNMAMTKVSATIVKETEKAYQLDVTYWTQADKPTKTANMWCPKSCCTITEKECLVADFILNQWVEKHNEYIRQYTTRLPSISFNMEMLEPQPAL